MSYDCRNKPEGGENSRSSNRSSTDYKNANLVMQADDNDEDLWFFARAYHIEPSSHLEDAEGRGGALDAK